MAVCGTSRTKLRKIIGIGLVLQVIVFTTYVMVFQHQQEIQIARQIQQAIRSTSVKTITTSTSTKLTQTNVTCDKDSFQKKCFDNFDKIISACKDLVFPGHLIHRNSWQRVNAERNGFVFSAYYGGSYLKILGISTGKLGPVSCQLWYRSNSSLEMVHTAGNVAGLPEGHGKRFSASHYTCNLPPEKAGVAPFAVSIVKDKCAVPDNVVPITVIGNQSPNRKFTVCVSPFNFRYGRAFELIEWIELNKILGANRFVFYNYSTAPNVDQVLNSYTKQGTVEVVDWKLPVGVAQWPPSKNREEIHYFGQLASLNECLLRNRGRSEYVVNLDLDEYIIPRKKEIKTWTEMLSSQPDGTGYMIANVFFRKEWETPSTNYSWYETAKKYKLVTLLQLQHEKTVHNYRTRSKYIVKPGGVEVMGIHNIWRSGGKIVNVPHDVALLHHYRNWLKYADKQTRLFDDTIVEKFKDDLINNVVRKWDSLPGVQMNIQLCDKPKDIYGAC